MGIQNATAATLALPDLTTTVLTRTLTALASERLFTRASAPATVRRLLAVVTMGSGAAFGALLVLRVSLTAALALAFALVAFVTAASTQVEEAEPAPAHG